MSRGWRRAPAAARGGSSRRKWAVVVALHVVLWAVIGSIWIHPGGCEEPPPDVAAYGGDAAGAVRIERSSERQAELVKLIEKLRPLHKPLAKPRPGDWLSRHREPGQTFMQYLRSDPEHAFGRHNVIYVQPLGEFTPKQREVVKLTAEYLGLCYSLPVRIKKDIPLSVIPDRARRTHPTWGDKQVLAGYVLDGVLEPRLPDDAAAYIALTASDLWPGRGWNFVFGLASLRERTGVWSIYRKGNVDGGEAAFRKVLLRTVKTAAHETGHIFSMRHCIQYECCMCGTNSLDESDRRPLAFCGECVAKICWATGADPAKRFRALAGFCRKHGLAEEARFFERELEALASE